MRSEKHIHLPPSCFIAKRHLTRPCVASHDTLGVSISRLALPSISRRLCRLSHGIALRCLSHVQRSCSISRRLCRLSHGIALRCLSHVQRSCSISRRLCRLSHVTDRRHITAHSCDQNYCPPLGGVHTALRYIASFVVPDITP